MLLDAMQALQGLEAQRVAQQGGERTCYYRHLTHQLGQPCMGLLLVSLFDVLPTGLGVCSALSRPPMETSTIGIIGYRIIDHTGGRGMNSPIASQFARARNARFVVSGSRVPATTGVVSIAANQAIGVLLQE
jgi:hypothetical protein